MALDIVNSDALTIEHVGRYAKLHANFAVDGVTVTSQAIGVITSVEHRKGADGALETAVTVDLGVTPATYVLDGSFIHLGEVVEDLAAPTPDPARTPDGRQAE